MQRVKTLQEQLDKKNEDFAKLSNAFWTLVVKLRKKNVLTQEEFEKISLAHEDG